MTILMHLTGNDEYLEVQVSGDVELNAQPVQIGVGDSAGTATWHPAQWAGTAGTSRLARTTDTIPTANLPAGASSVYYRVQDATETIVDRAGTIYVGG